MRSTKLVFLFALIASFVLGCKTETPASNNEPAVNNAPVEANVPVGSRVKNPDRIFQTDNLEVTTIKTPTGAELKLWVMDNEDKRREGMMFLRDGEVKDNEGMIFVFPEVQKLSGNYSFWMHNTILPLDIDYISKDKKILNVGLGKAMNDDPVKPAGDYFYVIELKQGMSEKYGLKPGVKVQISDSLNGKP